MLTNNKNQTTIFFDVTSTKPITKIIIEKENINPNNESISSLLK